ncbi:hypothetical protein GCM10011487_19160 [Steroidobacter agaridevorans]|uniref:TIGR03118 family protein n=2 Tax=Steroidobacter agaridevorans TaxID=2695856 RepID=A0A829YB48_9GAMM|nr:hypothetical protein GCM10011487_19160 [Steroidobacter agaridevorans]
MAILLATLVASSAIAQGYPDPPQPPPPPTPPPPSPTGPFAMTPLVSNGAIAATVTDPNLVNPWGVALAPGLPIWVTNNLTQTSTAYDPAGTLQITVSLPSTARGPASPTGLVFNGSTDFVVSSAMASAPAQFIMVGESGTLLAWSPDIDPANALVVHDDAAGGAVYKGLAIATNGSANLLFAADFHNGKIDVFDGQFQKIAAPGGFADPQLPADYAPFGVQAVTLGGVPMIVVAYAQHTADNLDEEVKGAGLGIVNVFDPNGSLLRRLVSPGAQANAPWGIALAPASFGPLGNLLLIGNFGDGVINAFDPNSGAFVDTIKDASGQPIVNDGLWGLAFAVDANNQPIPPLYFAAGIADETAGVFGRIDPQSQ